MTAESAGHSVCPKCGGHGLARRVTIRDGRRTVVYECDICHHGWEIVTPIETSQS